ncbi:porphobilinogen deaminase [Bacillus rossius redtenbacheri]|uniref:porphobilinogen deaminase n=1 Tax=Bacillus rossius redtenbacheri TaxID=93214 RepID=UPI002FDCB9D5
MNDNNKTIRVGSRKSQLALIQTNQVVDLLKELYPDRKFEVVTMWTLGDRVLDRPLPKIGEKSLFTKELETALDQEVVDLVVHSLKDLPTALPDGLCIGAVGRREDARDALVLHSRHEGKTLGTLPKGSVIGTSSLRRTAQLQRRFPQLQVKDVRGNLNTRLAKLDGGETFDGLVLAAAGLQRMGWGDRVSQVLGEEEMLYAVGQGALAVECREGDAATLQLLETLQHGTTMLCVVAERSFLSTLGGGCSAPVAVHSRLAGGRLSLTGAVWSLDGAVTLQHSAGTRVHYDELQDDGEPLRKCPYRIPKLFCGAHPGRMSYSDLGAAEKLGRDVAVELIERGAVELMSEAKQHVHAGASAWDLKSPVALARGDPPADKPLVSGLVHGAAKFSTS